MIRTAPDRGRPWHRRAAGAPLLAAVGALLAAGEARGEWLQPDPSYREAQLVLRLAIRDTAGHGADPTRLDSLGVALLRLGRSDEAERVFRRSLAIAPGSAAARAGLGKRALFAGRLAEAESLLAGLDDPDAARDRFAARLRRGDYRGAAAIAEEAGEAGRAPLLEALAEAPCYRIGGRPEAVVPWTRSWPVPLVRVRLNGQSVLMALDTGAEDLILDESAARRCGVRLLPSRHLTFWNGSRAAVRNALVERLEIGGIRVERVPAGTLPLGGWSIELNPHAERVAGVIGLELLRRFTTVLDYRRSRLELSARPAAAPGAARVPFEIWGAAELTVHGSLAGGRRMAMVVQTGVPGCGVAAPAEVFEELGIKPGVLSRLVRGAGSWLRGRPWTQVTVPSVSLGAVVADRVPGWQGGLDSAELWRHGVRRDALLSHDFFRGRRVTFDWEGQALLVEE